MAIHIAKDQQIDIIGQINTDPKGTKHFFVKDPYNNIFQYIESDNWFKTTKAHSGGPYGAFIGVSDLQQSKTFYEHILGYDEVLYEGEQAYEDLLDLPSGNLSAKRCILTHSEPRTGPFSKMLGSSQIELLQVEGRQPNKIFENRYWGDLGFIHLCFDIVGMDVMRKKCTAFGTPFTVDSAKANTEGFDMGEAAGHFSYIEDPDGTLIEFVETHKIPVLIILSALAFNRVK